MQNNTPKEDQERMILDAEHEHDANKGTCIVKVDKMLLFIFCFQLCHRFSFSFVIDKYAYAG